MPYSPSPAPRIGRELPIWLLILVPAIFWVAMAVLDIVLLALNHPPQPGLHSLVLCAAVTLTILAARTWDRQQAIRRATLVVDQVMRHVSREAANVHRAMCSLNDDAPTQPIPHIRIVGTAAVAASVAKDDELPGYAKGYVDGLARKPMGNGNGKVIPIEGAKG